MGLTLKQLAEIAGVSTSTASRALRDQPGISPATRARIHSLAAELGYRPNALGRALQRQSSGTIGSSSRAS
nr:LacI family DNA-binding transcriptional regulator [Corynebacterium uropygiale]